MDKDTADRIRGMIRRVPLKNVRDDQETQRGSVEVAEGIWRDDVEILQPQGFAGMPTEDGAVAIAIAIGGDEGDLVVLPVSNPSKRMGGLKPGDVGMNTPSGDKFVLGADGNAKLHVGGSVLVEATGSIVLKVGGCTLTISGAGFAFAGGTVTHNGKNIGDTHEHTGVVPGAAQSGPPA